MVVAIRLASPALAITIRPTASIRRLARSGGMVSTLELMEQRVLNGRDPIGASQAD